MFALPLSLSGARTAKGGNLQWVVPITFAARSELLISIKDSYRNLPGDIYCWIDTEK